MIKHRAHIVVYTSFVFTYLGLILYFLTIRPGGADGNINIIYAIITFASGGMMMIALYAVTLYLFRHGEKAALYFALMCISAGVRFFVLEGSQTITWLLPDISDGALYAARYTSINLFVFGITGFILDVFMPLNKYRKWYQILRAVTFAVYVITAVTAVLRDGDTNWLRLAVVISTVALQLSSLFVIVKSPSFKLNRMNKLYFVTVLVYMVEAFFAGFFAARFPNVPVFSQTLFVIAHIIILSDHYSRAIIDNEQSHAKMQFFRRMNHDMRTPLTKVSTNIQIANMKPQTDYERLTRAQDEIMRISEMIDTALDDSSYKWGEHIE